MSHKHRKKATILLETKDAQEIIIYFFKNSQLLNKIKKSLGVDTSVPSEWALEWSLEQNDVSDITNSYDIVQDWRQVGTVTIEDLRLAARAAAKKIRPPKWSTLIEGAHYVSYESGSPALRLQKAKFYARIWNRPWPVAIREIIRRRIRFALVFKDGRYCLAGTVEKFY